MVCTREAAPARRALGVLELVLRGQREMETDLCDSLKAAVLQVLQRISAVSMSQEHAAEGDRCQATQTHSVFGNKLLSKSQIIETTSFVFIVNSPIYRNDIL